MRGAKQQAQTAGPGEAYERHRSRPKIWPRIRAGGPGRSGQEAQVDPGRRPRRIRTGGPGGSRRSGAMEPRCGLGRSGAMTPMRSPSPSIRFREIRGDDPFEEPRCGFGRSGAMTPIRSPGAVPGDPGR
ncbi:hypothetical protein ACOSP7_009028 [Xanthoceras sorbifolium]